MICWRRTSPRLSGAAIRIAWTARLHPETIAKGHFLLGPEQLSCHQCGETSIVAVWRLRIPRSEIDRTFYQVAHNLFLDFATTLKGRRARSCASQEYFPGFSWGALQYGSRPDDGAKPFDIRIQL